MIARITNETPAHCLMFNVSLKNKKPNTNPNIGVKKLKTFSW